MVKVDNLIKQSLKLQTTQQSKPSETYSHSDKAFIYVWRGLQAGKFITKDEVVNGTEYKYWRRQLHDLTDEDLKAGFKATDSFTGYLTWAEFRKLCKDSTKTHASHRAFKALPNKPLDGEELRARLKKMREGLKL